MSKSLNVERAWGAVDGTALVMREGFSPRYDLDRLTGVISRIGHSVPSQCTNALPRLRSIADPSPAHALPCMQESSRGSSCASLSIKVDAFCVCEK